MAFRSGPLKDSAALSRKIFGTQRLLAPSPEYLGKRGRPQNPSDLAHHTVIIGPADPSPNFSFSGSGRTVSVRVDSRLVITLDEGAVAGAIAGLGIVTTNFSSCHRELAHGALVQVLADWDTG